MTENPLTTTSSSLAPELRLLADVGGTNARFALENAQGEWLHIKVLPCAQYASLADATRAYLAITEVAMPRHATIAIANPVRGDWVEMTNHHWKFSIEATRLDLGLENLFVTNDFTALAMALPYIHAKDLVQIGGRKTEEKAVLGLLGAGTGLGVSGLIPADDRWISLGSEGGHVSFSPCDEKEQQILAFVNKEFPHVSAERLISGPGIQLIYRALCSIAGQADAPSLNSPEIVERARFKTDAICIDTIRTFSGMLGSMAGNVALMLGSLGGVYLGGGVVLKFGDAFDKDYFRERFEAKGRFKSYLAPIPCFLITAEFPAFLGVSAILRDELTRRAVGGSLVQKIAQMRNELAPAERAVADFALANTRSMTELSVSLIAQKAKVSEPTVIRFCRSMGFQGLSEFKLRLASGLSGTSPLSFSQVHWQDAPSDFSAKVLDNTITALLQARNSLDSSAIERAIESLVRAARVEVFAIGQWLSIAEDAQNKLLRFGFQTALRSNLYTQNLVAQNLSKSDALLVLSRNGQNAELNQSVRLAKEAGASIIALCPSNTPLAEYADILIATPSDLEQEGSDAPMISRTIHLSFVDVLSIGLAVRLGQGKRDTLAFQSPHFG